MSVSGASSSRTCRPSSPSAPPRLPAALMTIASGAHLAGVLIGLLGLAIVIMLPPLPFEVPPEVGLVIGLALFVLAIWIGMRREHLHGGLAFLVVASLYAAIGVALAYLFVLAGAFVALAALLILTGWCLIYGSNGTPWYDRPATTQDALPPE